MKQLFVSDLEGTLLNEHSLVSSTSAAIISELTAQGVLFTVATARTPATVTQLLANTQLTLPAIVFTGAAEYDLNSRCYTSTNLLTDTMAQHIEEVIRSYGVAPMRYVLDSGSIINAYYEGHSPHPSMQKFIDERCRLALKRIYVNHPSPPEPEPGRTILIFAMGDYDAITCAARQLNNEGNCYVSCYTDPFYPNAGVVEVYAANTSKAQAVKAMAQRLGIERVTVFGDNLNDLPMMAIADVAVAVDNAMPEVKAAAHITIGPNTADSVAHYLLSHLH